MAFQLISSFGRYKFCYLIAKVTKSAGKTWQISGLQRFPTDPCKISPVYPEPTFLNQGVGTWLWIHSTGHLGLKGSGSSKGPGRWWNRCWKISGWYLDIYIYVFLFTHTYIKYIHIFLYTFYVLPSFRWFPPWNSFHRWHDIYPIQSMGGTVNLRIHGWLISMMN